MKVDTPIPKVKCLKCGYKMDATTHAYGNRRPHEGDISMCLFCGQLMLFNADLTLRLPTNEENRELRSNPDVIKADIVRASVMANKKLKHGRIQRPTNQAGRDDLPR